MSEAAQNFMIQWVPYLALGLVYAAVQYVRWRKVGGGGGGRVGGQVAELVHGWVGGMDGWVGGQEGWVRAGAGGMDGWAGG